MCDFSLHHVNSRPARVGDKLQVRQFGTGTIGLVETSDPAWRAVAVCVRPGTEIAFDKPIEIRRYLLNRILAHSTAVFRQKNIEKTCVHHDYIETPDGKFFSLQELELGQHLAVLQLPAEPKTAEEVKAQERVEVVA